MLDMSILIDQLKRMLYVLQLIQGRGTGGLIDPRYAAEVGKFAEHLCLVPTQVRYLYPEVRWVELSWVLSNCERAAIALPCGTLQLFIRKELKSVRRALRRAIADLRTAPKSQEYVCLELSKITRAQHERFRDALIGHVVTLADHVDFIRYFAQKHGLGEVRLVGPIAHDSPISDEWPPETCFLVRLLPQSGADAITKFARDIEDLLGYRVLVVDEQQYPAENFPEAIPV